MLGHSLALAALVHLACAFTDTLPIVAWSSHKSNALDALPSAHHTSPHSAAVFESILSNGDICEHDAIVLIDQPGLHASDLRTLSPSSPLVNILQTSPSSIQLPYVRRAEGGDLSVHDAANLVTSRCGARQLNIVAGQTGAAYEQGNKHVVCMSMPHLSGDASHRKGAMADHESSLARELEGITALFPKHLVILSGSAPSLARRQSQFDSPDPSAPLLDLQQPGNSTLPDGGILKRYQLLTPALITSLLIAFFLILPVVFLGVSALASIQSPLKLEAPKGFNAQEKKTQ
ncbi:hypothetical protein DENSPDRAFT_862139 [Dentipellis sp. KUC8613]|nr:hypothetical protein DENSPDRAFT_862139 [Dentipellis sp. KUC8613]